MYIHFKICNKILEVKCFCQNKFIVKIKENVCDFHKKICEPARTLRRALPRFFSSTF